ncbi:MAG: flavin reductase family protein [Chloroflexi bacterium]|nr:flavin reductase family protein [Chloroflexota bacterium]
MGRFATGVTVVTTRLGDELHGMTANAVTSVSLEPLLVLVCVDKTADTHDILAQSGVFALSILTLEQEALSNHFAKKETEGAHRLDGFPLQFGMTGCPILEGSVAYLDCRVVAQYPGGDHTIFVGEVVDAQEMEDGGPLVFYQGRYTQLA